MSFRTIAKVAIISLSTWQAASAQSGKATNTRVSCNESIHAIRQSQAEPRTRAELKQRLPFRILKPHPTAKPRARH
jgi:hypothetical protein